MNNIPEIECVNAPQPEASKNVLPKPVLQPQPLNVNSGEYCKQEQKAALQLMSRVLHDQQTVPKQPAPKKYNRKHAKNNKYTQEQRDQFQSLYSQHRKKWTALKYSQKVGVPVSIINNWRSMIIHHQSLQYCSHRNAYRNLLSGEELLALSNMLDNGDASMTEKDMRAELEKEFPDAPEVSLVTIDRALHGKRMVDLVGRDYSLKVGFRSPYANTPENKERRVQVMEELTKYVGQGRMWVSVDETHWEINSRRKRAWSKEGEKSLTKYIPQTQFSSITAVDERGFVDCLLVKDTVTADTFTDFFTKLVNHYKDDPVVFFLDVASVNDREALRRIGEDDKHAVLFNAPCSEELNPIELFFNEWKEHVDERIKQWPGIDQFLDVLKDTILHISPDKIQTLFAYVRNSVIPKVVRREDL